METKNTTKTFDAVKMMRDIRNQISEETKAMSFEELKKYIAEQLKNSKLNRIGR